MYSNAAMGREDVAVVVVVCIGAAIRYISLLPDHCALAVLKSRRFSSLVLSLFTAVGLRLAHDD